MNVDWHRLFGGQDHRFQMSLRKGDAAAFWSEEDASGAVWMERQRWLGETPGLYEASLAEGRAAMEEGAGWIRQWTEKPEPDWVVLSGGTAEEPRVLGGEVVFPSSWSLPEKLGLPLSFVHAPVPGLEEMMGKAIRTFLAKLPVGAFWERENWGLSADAELNHHPARDLPGLKNTATLEATWLRLERQFFTRLPETGCLLFGIRVSHHRLDQLASQPGVAEALAHHLESMDERVAAYKGLTGARPALVLALRNHLSRSGLTSPDASGSGQ